jgi:hypothetical protein
MMHDKNEIIDYLEIYQQIGIQTHEQVPIFILHEESTH